MNAGLSNLDTLKRYLLAPSLVAETTFDGAILAIGLGVAGMFERRCNRRFEWSGEDTEVFTANREHVVVPRYPVVAVDQVELRGLGGDWTTLAEEPSMVTERSGLVQFGATLGAAEDQVRVTWSGGYWWEALEPTDEEYPTAKPDGATELPGDLRAAWLIQCEAVWQQRDKLGTGIVEPTAVTGSLAGLDLVPMVKGILEKYVRYQLS